MKYHINGGPFVGGPFTLIHAEEGDEDSLSFIVKLLREAFNQAPPLGGPVRWSNIMLQRPMSKREAQGLIETVDLGDYIGYAVHLPTYRNRKLGIELAERKCSCDSEESVFVLNERLYTHQRGETSEQLLISLGGRPWERRISDSQKADKARSKPHLN
ncbi:MAG: hypothetical protein R3251_00655 [Candidatus Spechtbacterales bacterium]|nr:hypothetical protein [Candidatus Spechtbacterales bacterium]